MPIVLVSPRDGKELLKHSAGEMSIQIKGSFKNVKARNVLGTIGSGDEYIVVSTPISGWLHG